MVRRFAISVVSVGLALGVVCTEAGAQSISPISAISPIGPKQLFTGVVNGSTNSAVIRMACFGPIRPYQMGHPMAGQSVAVTRGLPVASVRAVGFTGEASA